MAIQLTTTNKIRRIRIFLYAALALSSSAVLGISIVRLVYTIEPREGSSVSDDDDPSVSATNPFYDPSVAELGFSGCLTLSFCLAMLFVLLKQKQYNTLSRNWFEITLNIILWALWLGGSAAASAVWYNLNYCIEYCECRILQALLGFAWLGWICINAILIPTLINVICTKSWDEHIFDQWTRTTAHQDNTSYKEQRAGQEANAIPWSYRSGEECSLESESCRLSTFSGIIPWMAWSDAASMRTNTVSRAGTHRLNHASSKGTLKHVTSRGTLKHAASKTTLGA